MKNIKYLKDQHKEDKYKIISSLTKSYPKYKKIIRYKEPYVLPLQTSDKKTKNPNPSPLSFFRSITRTRSTISDIVLSNEWQLFATFTFSTDRQDIQKCKRRMSYWFANQKKQYGDFKYIIVPEFHKDGKSLHFHALLSGYKGKLRDTGKVSRHKSKVYSLDSWQNGFANATKIKDKEHQVNISKYISKYITKDMPKLDNKKRYWCSKNVNRPVKKTNDLVSYPEENKVFENDYFEIYYVENVV